MESSSYKERLKARFTVWWRRLIPLMAFVYLLDIGTRFLTDTPMKAATINAYIAIPIVTLLLAVILAIISPTVSKIFRFFMIPAVFMITAIIVIVALAYLYSWWLLLGLMYVFMPKGGATSGGSGGSYSKVDDDFKALEEEWKRQDEWNNSPEKRAQDYRQWDKTNDPNQ